MMKCHGGQQVNKQIEPFFSKKKRKGEERSNQSIKFQIFYIKRKKKYT